MPFLLIREAPNYAVGAWLITEPLADLKNLLSEVPQTSINDYHAKRGIKNAALVWQRYAVYCLLEVLAERMGISFEGIEKNTYGEPSWLPDTNWHISYAHTQGVAVAILHKYKRVGIDVELVTDKPLRLAERFAAQEEEKFLESERGATLLWCAKEAMYKWYGKKQLIFKQDLLLREKETSLYGLVTEIHSVRVYPVFMSTQAADICLVWTF